ncbi:hypothetical protein PANA5342_3957 [Pantoea ananatis LMG 5342]|nr:hypothetical protein PANA5342_3957 [Pantoea ananatis LMG 5342]
MTSPGGKVPPGSVIQLTSVKAVAKFRHLLRHQPTGPEGLTGCCVRTGARELVCTPVTLGKAGATEDNGRKPVICRHDVCLKAAAAAAVGKPLSLLLLQSAGKPVKCA